MASALLVPTPTPAPTLRAATAHGKAVALTLESSKGHTNYHFNFRPHKSYVEYSRDPLTEKMPCPEKVIFDLLH